MMTPPFSLRRRTLLGPRLLVGLALASSLLGAALLSLPWDWLDTAENLTIDLRFQARGSSAPGSDSIIVGVADSSFTIAARAPAEAAREPALAAMATPWPWDRRVFAETVRRLRTGGARLIVFDIVFAAETEGDAGFARVLAEPGAPVVFASLWQEAHSAAGEGTVTLVEPRELLLAANGRRAGYANFSPDDDGVLRRLSTGESAGTLLGDAPPADGRTQPSLALAAARALRPATVAPPGYIDFRHPHGVIPTLPIEDLFLPDRWNGSWLQSGGLFRDHIVWVGPLAEIQFKDYHATPLGRMAGVEVQAQALETLLGRGPLQPLSRAAALACVWALALGGALATWACQRVSLQLVVVAGGILGWAGLAFALFSTAGLVLPVVAPLTAWLVATGGGVGVRFVTEQRERRRVRAVLGRYVSEEVARIIADQPENFSSSLRGGRREVTVLFADLRGFTSWVETAEPEEFVAQLNEYFRAVVDCVLAQGGTLQKFIGDAVLAVWGDTRSTGAAADAARAVNAALAMQQAVAQLNQAWAGRTDRRPMSIGIGLHHGIAMVGNVGHPQRMEFTVLGDVVNVASRLESANRLLGTGILLSGSIRDLLAASHRFLPLGPTLLKGKRESVDLFVPLGPLHAPAPEWQTRAEAAHAQWLAGDFSGAAATYAGLAAVPGAPTEFFRERGLVARSFSQTPPPAWTGTYRLETK